MGTAGCCGNPSLERTVTCSPHPPSALLPPTHTFCEKVDTGLLSGRCPTAFPGDVLWQGNETNEAAWNGPTLTTCHELQLAALGVESCHQIAGRGHSQRGPCGRGYGPGSVGKGPIHTPHSQLG